MKKIVLYNPSITTLNQGDKIIFESVKRELEPILSNAFCVDVSTHLPISNLFLDLLHGADYKFACGTNLLRNQQEIFHQWDIRYRNAKKVGPVILVGVGWQKKKYPMTPYTRAVYKRVLSKEHLHSVRDEYTACQLRKMGFNNVVNTGCPTLWQLTGSFCKTVPTDKAEKVVFTLTDYNRAPKKDKMIFDVLKKNYSNVYLWIQGYDDYEYAEQLGIVNDAIIINPDLGHYDNILNDKNIEYIGTRLHGGVRALQYKRRTMIIAVDNRAKEKSKDIQLPVVDRDLLTEDKLQDIIYTQRKTNMCIHEKEIFEWKKYYGLL